MSYLSHCPPWIPKRVILPVTHDIQILASSIADSNVIEFFWLPGHSDVYGNELADTTARWVAPHSTVITHISWAHAKSTIRLHLNSLWNAEWCFSVARSTINLFLRKTSDARIF